MWTDTTRVLYVRKGMALPGNLTEDEWAGCDWPGGDWPAPMQA